MEESNQNAAMLRYTQKEMLEEWKLRSGYFQTRTDCELVRDDGIDLDRLLQAEIDSRYEHLLSCGPMEMVPVMEIAGDCIASVDGNLAVTVVLPEDCVRVVELALPGWKRSVMRFLHGSDAKAVMQRNEWLCGGAENPVCVVEHRCIRAYSAVSENEFKPVKVLAVCRPVPGTYLFAPVAWDLLLGKRK